MIRMVLGAILALLAFLVILPGTAPKGEQDAAIGALVMLGLPAALLFYFGWYAWAATKRVVTRPHAALVWGIVLAAVLAASAIGVFLSPNEKDRGAGLLGLAVFIGLPAAALVLSGLSAGRTELKPKSVRDLENAAWTAEAAQPAIMGGYHCALCGSSDAVDDYFYFPPVNVTYIDYNKKRIEYNSAVNKGVSFCDRCIDRKKASLRPLLWLGLLISLPLCMFFFGIFGVIGFGMSLWSLRNREDIGDGMAYYWRKYHKIRLGLITTEGNLTRKKFNELAARQGPAWQGGLLTK